MISGSRAEGFRLKTSDADIMIWQYHFRVIWEISQSRYYNTNRKVYLLPPGRNTELQRTCGPGTMTSRHYLFSSKYYKGMCSALMTPFNPSPHGPCASGNFIATEYDYAHCFISDFWPPSASSWIDRCHSWPQPHIVDDIVKNGCHFVAIGHKLGHHENNEWRISFSQAEQKLVYGMNRCQFVTYCLLKLFLTEIINYGLDSDAKLLCSYHMKTAVFWVIQQNTMPHWCPQNLLECFWRHNMADVRNLSTGDREPSGCFIFIQTSSPTKTIQQIPISYRNENTRDLSIKSLQIVQALLLLSNMEPEKKDFNSQSNSLL
ncbi:uncharacterized protein LOC134249765 [Saccostrea cucullata]|uniref:uncharacterized protein LOC134249765 n=1 Tax=Saccostrea cuccullata TaxID=36930 RepID=UPI002ED30B39